jgi:chromatin remodeling complex protein RSC6
MDKAVEKKTIMKKVKKTSSKSKDEEEPTKKPVIPKENVSDKKTTTKTTAKTTAKTTDKPPTKTTKKKKDEKPEEEPVEEEPVEEEPKSVTTRTTPTRESISESFDIILSTIDVEIESIREAGTKTKGIKFLRGLSKNMKVLKTQSLKLIKAKKVTKSRSNGNSGFLKPVSISTDMAKFTGWDPKELRSRVEVTKYICDYIKEHNLQDPEDRRQIKPDEKLGKLLGYKDSDKTQPLRYYSLQTHLKQHFPKTD